MLLLGHQVDSHSVNPKAVSVPPILSPNLSAPLAYKMTQTMYNQEPQRRKVTGKSHGRKKKEGLERAARHGPFL